MIGRLLDNKYKIIRLIGRGGMGTVYEAEHVILNRRVAIKVLLPMYSSKTSAVKRFIREAQAASAIEHPNIVQVLDFSKEAEGTVYMVMELLKGGSLKSVLDQRGILPIPQAVAIAIQTLSALEAAHVKGIIHRDLKPENIYLSDSSGAEVVKIVDFGVAKFKELAGGGINLTRTGSVPGTPNYLAPELAKGGKEIDERIDIWAIGVVLYEMLTGTVPFVGENYNEVLSKILMAEVTPVRELSADVPEGLAMVVEKALAKDKEARYHGADEMFEALLPFQGPSGTALRTTTVLTGVDEEMLPRTPTGGGGVRRSSASGDALDPQLLAMTDSRPTHAQRSVRTVFGVIALSLAAAAGLLFGLLFNGTEDGKGEPAATAAQSMSMPADERHATGRGDGPGDDAPPIGGETPPGAAPDAADVTIELTGLPDGARVSVDGETMSLPLELERSDTERVLKITASGYRDYEQRVVPSTDRRLDISMKKAKPKATVKSKRKARRDRQTPTQEKDEPKSKSGGPWRQNPFAD